MNTPRADRTYIGLFGKRNSGKSSLINAICNQQVSIVSDTLGTTTDPVYKSMEILPLGPVCFIDTPGLDDEGEIGALRIKRAKDELKRCDVALIVFGEEFGETEKEIEEICKARKIPYIKVCNKSDLGFSGGDISVSAKTGENIDKLKEKIAMIAPEKESVFIADLINEGDIVILVTPIDESAPKGRIILPQQMVLRDILDAHAIPIVCQDSELEETLNSLSKPARMVITDSQVFGKVSKITPRNIPLTSFSILMARYKGDLKDLIQGFSALKALQDGDNVLISEGCTHHRQCNDIGTVKMPKWIEGYSSVKPSYHFTSGGEFPEDLSKYRVIVHCGGCMINEAEMKHRTEKAKKQGVPIVNYGIAIAGMNGILKRSLELFPDISALLD
jgi:[FeFe] hydrogenase H-cluster maturation GTPase HydF